jgi:hypothetical protein
MEDRSSPASVVEQARRASRSDAAPPAAKPDDRIAADWYAVRRNLQVGMTMTERGEFRRWARHVAAIYVSLAIIALAVTLLRLHGPSFDQLAGRMHATSAAASTR